jgi:hypothetical protein
MVQEFRAMNICTLPLAGRTIMDIMDSRKCPRGMRPWRGDHKHAEAL